MNGTAAENNIEQNNDMKEENNKNRRKNCNDAKMEPDKIHE